MGRHRMKDYPLCPVCGKATFLHHDKEHYRQYRCCDKKYSHSFFVPKPAAVSAPSMSKLFGKTDFKRMRYPVHVILTALSMFYLGKNSFRNIALILRTVMNVQVSHTTISNWCTKLAPMLQNIALQLIPALNFNSDEWHADETVVKIHGEKYYLWLILDSETRFVLGFHPDRRRDSPQAFAVLNAVKPLGNPRFHPLSATVIRPTGCLLRPSMASSISAWRASMTTPPTTLLSALTSSSRLGTRPSRVFLPLLLPTASFPCSSFSTTSSALIPLLTTLLLLSAPASCFPKSVNASFSSLRRVVL